MSGIFTSGPIAAEDLIGRVVWEVYPQIVGTRTETLMRRAAGERIPIAFETRSADGRRFLIKGARPESGAVIRIVSNWRALLQEKR